MTLGRGCGYELRRVNSDSVIEKGIGFGNRTQTIGRKRIVVSPCLEGSPLSSSPTTPPRKRPHTKRFHLGALPQDILVQILCCLDHDDMKKLFHVSKSVREAALIAEKFHFAFSTPSSKTARLTPYSDLENIDNFEEAPNAPRHRRIRSPFSDKKLAGISVALFA